MIRLQPCILLTCTAPYEGQPIAWGLLENFLKAQGHMHYGYRV